MNKAKVVITDYGFENVNQEVELLSAAGFEVIAAQCKSPQELIEVATGASALLVQWATVNAEVIDTLEDCKVIVRYGIGVDNVDLLAAKAKGIAVCNVPTYCIDEVADHSLAFALSLGRGLSATKQQLESVWKITPPSPLGAFRRMNFTVLGFGRISRAVLLRARAFGFQLSAYDPFISEEDMRTLGVQKKALHEALAEADILSLHLPLNKETQHIINADSIAVMKPSAILVNTSRGGLIDTLALAEALASGRLAGAGLDVFETEPLEATHPLRAAPNTELTSHTAWYSTASVPELQKLAAEEVLRGLEGKELLNWVN